MKRIWIAAVILVFCIALSFFSLRSTENRTKNFINSLDLLSEKILHGEKEAAIQASHEIISNWDKEKRVLYLFTYQQKLEKIGETLNLIPAYLSNDHLTEAQVECQRTIIQLQQVLEAEQISMDNIF